MWYIVIDLQLFSAKEFDIGRYKLIHNSFGRAPGLC